MFATANPSFGGLGLGVCSQFPAPISPSAAEVRRQISAVSSQLNVSTAQQLNF